MFQIYIENNIIEHREDPALHVRDRHGGLPELVVALYHMCVYIYICIVTHIYVYIHTYVLSICLYSYICIYI